jgi:type I restriction enzyme R subunit
MPGPHDENTFETGVVHEMTTHSGWTQQLGTSVDPDLLIIAEDLKAFLTETQPKAVEQLQQRLGDGWLARTAAVIASGLKRPGDVITLLRKGKVVSGVELDLAYYKPTHSKNPESVARYAANRLSVVRQLKYSTRNANTLDLALFINGLPVADAELKNGTGQTTSDAVSQYQTDRDPADAWFQTRSVVHFALDPNTVMMATAVGKRARFLPFNRGSAPEGLAGAGNYLPADGSHPTAYLWRDVWQRDAWLDLIQSFIHVQEADPTSAPSLVFPRYHQWDCVVTYVERARQNGPGHNELAMHSTGSGKTMTQAWLAHRLANLFGDNGAKVFDKVIVLTDRRVLDRSMQRQIEQFESSAARGSVVSITGNSKTLKQALESKTAKVVVSTIQKFPYIVRDIATEGQRFAVIIDEAHSSQSGESSQAMKQALSAVTGSGACDDTALEVAAGIAGEYEEIEAQEDPAAEMADLLAAARSRRDTISMFAFTATPKAKTLAQFGVLGDDGIRRPTHTYSMRQAIDEKFIMDMLANYTTYKSFYRLAANDGSALTSEEIDKSQALAAVRRFAMLHDHNISQKVQVIIEHFREHVRHRINGQAKAMIVTASRLHAVRYKQALDRYVVSKGYQGLKTLVAFSGDIIDPDGLGEPMTEPGMNGFGESQTEAKFATPEYQIMVVAEKYQTGFSQSLIHTIYVDKKLSGLTAVQTLSRGNRINPNKHETFVLDFINDADTIEAAYAQYLGEASAPDVEPQTMYETWEAVIEYAVIADSDIDLFSAAWFDPDFDPSRRGAEQGAKAAALSAAITAALAPAVASFNDLEAGRQDDFRGVLRSWVNQYAFLSQMVTWSDRVWEQRYQYTRLLSTRIARKYGDSIDLSDELQMTHYKLDKTFEGAIDPDTGAPLPPAFPGGGGSRMTDDEQVSLLEVLEQINERYGLELDERHLLYIEQAGLSLVAEKDIQQSAGNNSSERFIKEMLTDRIVKAFMLSADENFEFAQQVADRPEVKAMIEGPFGEFVWRLARESYRKSA